MEDIWPRGGQAKSSTLNDTKPEVAEQQEQANPIVIGWHVEFEDGSVELWKASDINGEPSFGRWVTPMISGGPTIDLAPEQDAD